MTHGAYGLALAILARRDQAMRSLQLGRERARDVDHDFSRVMALMQMTTAGFVTDDPKLARSGAEELLALADGRGFHSPELMARIFLGWARACLGEVDEGVRDIEKGLSLAEASGSVAGLPLLYVAAAHVYRMARRWERADELLDLATNLTERTGDKAFHPFVCFARARVLLELGDGAPAEAERLLLEAVESVAFAIAVTAPNGTPAAPRDSVKCGGLRGLRELVQQCLRFLQVRRVEAFGEPVVDG